MVEDGGADKSPPFLELRILATLVRRRNYGIMESQNFCGLMLKVSAAPRQQTTDDGHS